MENENLSYWEQLRQPPKEVLTKIKAGRLKGMTDIKPIWRIQKITEVFGPCGIGWKYSVSKQWTEQVSDNQILAFVNVDVFIKQENEWSEAIPGNGGSKLVAKESRGMYSSDEAFKMATTDALSSSFKMLGVAADIYLGAYDGSKYYTPEPSSITYATKEQFKIFKDYCVKESLDPKEIAVMYGISNKMTYDKCAISIENVKKDVESGEIGYRFAIPDVDDIENNTDEV
jgi:hypothetical protein